MPHGKELPIHNTMIEALGIEIIETMKNKVVMTMPVNEKTKQPMGFLHGGASVALAETIASVGSWLSVDQTTEAAVGLEINANHVRPKADGVVTGIGIPLFHGRKTMVWEIKIVDEREKLICISRCTVAIVPRQD